MPHSFNLNRTKTMTREEIDAHVRHLLQENFDCDVSILNDETNMFEAFDLDSIDAVDLVVDVQKKYDISLKPDDFKEVRNYGDLINVITAAFAAKDAR